METINRINGTRVKAIKTVKAKRNRKEENSANALKYSHAYVISAIVASALVNGYHAYHETQNVLGVVFMALVPFGIFILCKQGAYSYRASKIGRRLSYACGIVASALLLLSLWHLTNGIADITGLPGPFACLLAIGIDCGLVVSELVAVGLSE